MKIEKKIPMPETNQSGRPSKYPWRELEIGDSFEIPAPNLMSARSHCNAANSRYGEKKFQARIYKGKIRVWRVK